MSTETADLPTYADLFPMLPQVSHDGRDDSSSTKRSQWRMEVRPTTVTQVFTVPLEEQRLERTGTGSRDDEQYQQAIFGIIARTGCTAEFSFSKDEALSVCLQGKISDVQQAKKLLLSRLQTQVTHEVAVNKKHHRFILGKGGLKLREMEARCSVSIKIPRAEDPSDAIRVMGTLENVRRAEAEIQDIADEQDKLDMVRLPIPRAYHPLIQGVDNTNTKAIMAETGVRVRFPPPGAQGSDVVVSGEKQSVALVVARVQALYDQMRQTCGELTATVPKAQHKYVIGPKGSNLRQVMRETGVFVDMPDRDLESDTITLRGPHHRLVDALKKVYTFAASMTRDTTSIPRWLHRHVIGRKGVELKKIVEDAPEVSVQFSDTSDDIVLEGPPDQVRVAKAGLELKAAELLRTHDFAEVHVDPRFHKDLVGRRGQTINKLKADSGARITIPESGSGSDLIRIDGSPTAVQVAKTMILAVAAKLEAMKEVYVIVPQRLHSELIGKGGVTVKSIIAKFNDIAVNFPASGDTSDLITLRGDSTSVDAAKAYITKLADEIAKRNYEVQVPVFKRFHKHIIGRGGATLSKIRSDTNTRITVPNAKSDSDLITVVGVQANVHRARDMILELQETLAKIVSDTVSVPHKYHAALIGQGGRIVRSIEAQCGGVLIKFPKDNASDDVTLRGPEEEVAQAKGLLIELANERALSNHREEVDIEKQFHRFLIGKGGETMQELQEKFKVRLFFPAVKADGGVVVVLGKKESCASAKAALLQTVEELKSRVVKTTEIDTKFYRELLARRAHALTCISEEFGGVRISLPRKSDDDYANGLVTVQGPEKLVDDAIKALQQKVEDIRQTVTVELRIAREHRPALLGAGGKHVRRITEDLDVVINFPKKRKGKGGTTTGKGKSDNDIASQEVVGTLESGQENGVEKEREQKEEGASSGSSEVVVAGGDDHLDTVTIRGKQSACDLAVAALMELVPTVDMLAVNPDYVRHLIGTRGENARKLMNEFDVFIKFPKQEASESQVVIKGPEDQVAACKAKIEEIVAKLDAETVVKLEVDRRFHSVLIGRKGRRVTELRERTGAQISFPRRNATGDEANIIVVSGEPDAVAACQAEIEAVVQELASEVEAYVDMPTRFHGRIIGAKGAHIKRLMEDFGVRINMPKDEGQRIVIRGYDQGAEDCKDHLLLLLQEFEDEEAESVHGVGMDENGGLGDGDDKGKEKKVVKQANNGLGFVMKGAPWEDAFPSLGGTGVKKSAKGVWGKKSG